MRVSIAGKDSGQEDGDGKKTVRLFHWFNRFVGSAKRMKKAGSMPAFSFLSFSSVGSGKTIEYTCEAMTPAIEISGRFPLE
jgi:hypothetical protein